MRASPMPAAEAAPGAGRGGRVPDARPGRPLSRSSGDDVARGGAAFPLVGAAIGAAVGGTAAGLVHVLPALAAAGIALAVGAAADRGAAPGRARRHRRCPHRRTGAGADDHARSHDRGLRRLGARARPDRQGGGARRARRPRPRARMGDRGRCAQPCGSCRPRARTPGVREPTEPARRSPAASRGRARRWRWASRVAIVIGAGGLHGLELAGIAVAATAALGVLFCAGSAA